MSVSGYNGHYEFVLGAGAKVEDPLTGGDEIPPWRGKKCDKQLTFIVRVSCWAILKLSWLKDLLRYIFIFKSR